MIIQFDDSCFNSPARRARPAPRSPTPSARRPRGRSEVARRSAGRRASIIDNTNIIIDINKLDKNGNTNNNVNSINT